MNGRPWTRAEIATLHRHYPHMQTAKMLPLLPGRSVTTIYRHAKRLGLRKSAEYLASPDACRLRRGDNVGAAYRYPKGHVPANKGLRRPGWAPGRMRETQFKPGNVSKRWDPEVYTIGALRINADGYLDIKIRNGLRAWEQLSRHVWRTERGPIPPGMLVRAINGDRDDTRIENLRLASRRELMRENTVHNLPQPLAHVIQLRGALNRRINRLEKDRGKNA
jgi:hypothetical protein